MRVARGGPLLRPDHPNGSMNDKVTPSRKPVLSVRGLTTEVATAEGRLTVVDGLSFDVAAGETLCIAGESGSGKSMTALSIMRLLP